MICHELQRGAQRDAEALKPPPAEIMLIKTREEKLRLIERLRVDHPSETECDSPDLTDAFDLEGG